MLLTVGLLLTALLFGAWELMIARHALTDPHGRAAYLVRAFSTAAILAAWAGGYLLRSRSRLDRAREELHRAEAAFAERVRRSEQAAGMGALTRLVAHELRDPLNSLALHCTLLRRAAEKQLPTIQVAQLLEGDMARLSRLVEGYVSRHQRPREVVRPIQLASLVREVVGEWPEGDVALASQEDLPELVGDPDRMRQLVENLLLTATSQGGRAWLELGAEPGYLTLTATAPGKLFDEPSEVFRAFHAPTLGLTVVRDVAREHAGEVAAINLPKGGTQITCRFSTGRKR